MFAIEILASSTAMFSERYNFSSFQGQFTNGCTRMLISP